MSHTPNHIITILAEQDIPRGWRYHIEILDHAGNRSEHWVRLAWVDHNHWAADRALSPSTVVRGVIACVLAQRTGEDPLPERFDAATCRRWVPGIDQDLNVYLV